MRAGLTAGAALALVAARDGTQSGNLRVFDAAWHAVARDYWDPGLHGIDWPALQARYRPLAGAAPDAAALYAVLDELLGAVGDSHVFAVPPGEVRAERADHHAPRDLLLAGYRQQPMPVSPSSR